MITLVLAGCVGVLLWLALSEVSFRRNERRKAEAHADYLRRYHEQTERLYGRDGGT